MKFWKGVSMNLDFIDRIRNMYVKRACIILVVLAFSIIFLIVAIFEMIKDLIVSSYEYLKSYIPRAIVLYKERVLWIIEEKWDEA